MLSRRVFLEGAVVTGAAGAGVSSASAEPLVVESWMKEPGAASAPYGQPSRMESPVGYRSHADSQARQHKSPKKSGQKIYFRAKGFVKARRR
jgi:hypothetical protein